MKLKQSTFALALILALSVWQAAAGTITYTFVADQEDSNSAGYTGSITLSTESSSSGTLANILGISISGPWIDNQQYDSATQFLSLLSPGFTWTPTAITLMDVGVRQNSDQRYLFSVYNDGLYAAGLDYRVNGSWVASSSSVPDRSATWLLAVGSLLMLAALRHFPALRTAAIKR